MGREIRLHEHMMSSHGLLQISEEKLQREKEHGILDGFQQKHIVQAVVCEIFIRTLD